MKKIIRTLIIAMMFSFPLLILAQNPPHPNGGSAPGSGNTPVGGGAPIDGGITVMLLLAAGYATRKTITMK